MPRATGRTMNGTACGTRLSTSFMTSSGMTEPSA
jgi:hypothetical protein